MSRRHHRCVGCIDSDGLTNTSIILPGQPYVVGEDDRGAGSFHFPCYLEGECFADLRDRVLGAIYIVASTLRVFYLSYPENDVREIARDFGPELTEALAPLLNAITTINLLAAKADEQQTTGVQS